MPIMSFSRLFLFLALLLGNGVFDLEASRHVYCRILPSLESANISTDQPYRTAYHFQPAKNWMNDPNGPMIYKGIYHLFYQHNPAAAVWGNISWGHSTSTDLVNWIPQKLAIFPSEKYDVKGAFSGSATILPSGIPYILYTGVGIYNQQVQNLATPKNASDPYLIDWVKSPKNPLMEPNVLNQIDPAQFRDPTTAWLGHDGHWRVVIGSQNNREGLAVLYTSKDFVHWIKSQNPLHSAKDTGMWECPDFFPVNLNSTSGVDTSCWGPNVKHVLKVSLGETEHDHYTIGTYDRVKDVYTPDVGIVDGDSGLRYDYGKFYASKSFFDSAKNRRILWSWIPESSSAQDDIEKGWSGLQGIPRVLWLDKSGKQLMQWPINEIDMLRTNPIKLSNQVLNGGSVLQVPNVTAQQADIEISFEVSYLEKAEVLDPSWTNPQLLCTQMGPSVKGSLGPFGLLVLASKDMQEHTAVFFRIFRGQTKYVVLMCSDQSRSSMNPDNDRTTYGAFVDLDPVHEKLSLRTLIDHSIVESFAGGGKSCITARVYPTLAINDGASYAFNNGTENVKNTTLIAWSMKKANIN